MRVPKLCGADIELGNFILGSDDSALTSTAARELLAQIDGVAAHGSGASSAHRAYTEYSQDWGRKFLPANGGAAYVDLGHLELCVPEVLSAYDHVAAWHAMLRIARDAQIRANQARPAHQPIQVLVNNCDNAGNSYGSHLNFLMSREGWDNLFNRKLHQMLVLAAFQASSIVITGQGKVGSQNGRPAVAYQISQRADFFETLTGVQTTYNRPIVNSRDEPLCGAMRFGTSLSPGATDYARLHVIFFDNTLCEVSGLLKVGMMQLVLAMIEAGCADPGLILDDPVEAVMEWSHDPSLEHRARLADGRRLSAVEVQMLFLEQARTFGASGGFDGIVPRYGELLSLWGDTLDKLHRRDWDALSRRLDWVLKWRILQRALELRPGLDWSSAELLHLDQMYASLDDSGLYWIHQRQGLVERAVDDDAIDRFVSNPPDDTRAWTRAMLMRIAGADGISEVDWDAMEFRIRRNYWSSFRKLSLADPLRFTREETESLIDRSQCLEEVLDALDRPASAASGNEPSALVHNPN